MQFIRPQVLNNRSKLHKRFFNASPYKHLTIDNFLTPSAWKYLLEEFPAHESRDGIVGDYGKKNGIKGGKRNVRDFGKTYVAWDNYLKSPEFLEFVSDVSGIPDLLYDPDYVGAGIHENFEGARSRVHIDFNYHPKTGYHRRLNMIIYISPEWQAEYGGALKVYENGFKPDAGQRRKLECLPNRCVLFETTEHSWHGVESIILPDDAKHLTRKSITVYFYTKDRPPEETAERHSTIYTPGEFPKKAIKFSQLDAPSKTAVKRYERSVNGLIKSLYGEHARLYKRIEQLEAKERNAKKFKLPFGRK